MLAIAGCSNAEQPGPAAFEVTGRLQDKNIREASGLARSQRQANVLWIINDQGSKERVHAIDQTGIRLGEFDLKKSKNRDWEDLASFQRDDIPYLMIADIGDNAARRRYRTLYIVEEPDVGAGNKATTSWRVNFKYPNGPRDSESAAVDIENNRALVLSKRDLPPQLYAVPLQTASPESVMATRLGSINSLPKPTRQQLRLAPATKDWNWQPVGMDISQDNLAAVILTYRAVFYYQRQPDQDWFDALNTRPLRISLGNFQNAESVAFGDEKRTVFVTGEDKHARLLRVDLAEESAQPQ